MTPEREKRIRDVLDKRQPGLAVVLENVQDPHNISAVMRTCDSVGIQDIYVLNTKIPKHNKWGAKSSSSAYKWLSIHEFDNTSKCFETLRNNFTQILSTKLGENSASLYDLDLTIPTALVFGNEHDGVSEEASVLCDGNFLIPQAGIIRSLNISVACAVSIYEAFRQKLIAGQYDTPQLAKDHYSRLQKEWSGGQLSD